MKNTPNLLTLKNNKESLGKSINYYNSQNEMLNIVKKYNIKQAKDELSKYSYSNLYGASFLDELSSFLANYDYVLDILSSVDDLDERSKLSFEKRVNNFYVDSTVNETLNKLLTLLQKKL